MEIATLAIAVKFRTLDASEIDKSPTVVETRITVVARNGDARAGGGGMSARMCVLEHAHAALKHAHAALKIANGLYARKMETFTRR